MSFGDANTAGSLETTPKAVHSCGIRRKNFSSQSSKSRHQITWYLITERNVEVYAQDVRVHFIGNSVDVAVDGLNRALSEISLCSRSKKSNYTRWEALKL